MIIEIKNYGNIWFYKRGSNDNQDNITKTYHENGKLKSEGNLKDGKEEGLVKTYFENGQLKEELNFKNGELIN